MALGHIEVVGRVRGLDGTDFPANKKCQIFFRLANGDEIVLYTKSHSMQTMFEVAFSQDSEATVVYEDDGVEKKAVQIRFNQSGERHSAP